MTEIEWPKNGGQTASKPSRFFFFFCVRTISSSNFVVILYNSHYLWSVALVIVIIHKESNNQPRRRKKKKKKKNQTTNPREERKKKVKRCGWILLVGSLCVFNYNIVIELWVMKTENSQNVFLVSITHNSKIRKLSDGNRVMETELSFTKKPFYYGSHHFWIMGYGNWKLSYGNCESKRPLIFQVIRILTEFRACPSKLEYFYTIIFLPCNLLKQSTISAEKKN